MSFRRWFARTSKKMTLYDFVGTNGLWSSMEEFSTQVNRLISRSVLGEWDKYVELFPIRPKIKRLYQELTQVVQRLVPDQDLVNFVFPALPRPQVPKVGIEVGTKCFYLTRIPPVRLRVITRTIITARKPHPVTQYFDQVPDHVAYEHSTYFMDCRRYLLPVVHDEMLRLLFRGLPVRYKFWFLQGSNPNVVCCETPDCQGIESERHLLFDCWRVRRLWSKLLPMWRVLFGTSLSWKDIVLCSQVSSSVYPRHSSILRVCWSVLCCIVLYQVWSTRNKWVFEQRQLPPVDASVKVVLSSFASHFRHLVRVFRYSPIDTASLKWIKKKLFEHEPYASYYQDHPVLLQQRSQVLSACWRSRPR